MAIITHDQSINSPIKEYKTAGIIEISEKEFHFSF